jgi:pimeloyl-ACP methyl ester carboxylesterase
LIVTMTNHHALGACGRSADLTLDGRHLEAAWWGPGPGTAPTLVLLHEGLGSVGLWRDFPARLAAATGCGVFAWSRFGYGRSAPTALPRPLDYMQREAREVVGRGLDAAGIGPCLLVGHSDGGSIAALVASLRPEARLRGLVLIAPHFFVEELSVTSIAAIRRQYETGGLRARLARYHTDVDGAFHGWASAWLDPGFPAIFNLTAALRAVHLPMLILQGTDDPYGTIAHARLAEREVTGPVRTVLVPAGHSPHVEATEATIAAISGFARAALQAPAHIY